MNKEGRVVNFDFLLLNQSLYLEVFFLKTIQNPNSLKQDSPYWQMKFKSMKTHSATGHS